LLSNFWHNVIPPCNLHLSGISIPLFAVSGNTIYYL
jgi:hypothetical protein